MNAKCPCKIVIAGDGGTGKSTLISVKKTGKFSFSSKITIGVDFACLDISHENQPISFLIYDLGGQERFHFLHDAYLKGTRCALLLYDITRPSTYHHISHWLDLIHKENASIPIILVGTKIDLGQPEDFQEYEQKWEIDKRTIKGGENVVSHIFISSKDFIGIDHLFSTLINAISSRIPTQEVEIITIV